MAGNGTLECCVGELAAPVKNALVGGPFGSDLVSADYVPSGVPVIRGQNLSNGMLVGGEFVFVSERKADKLSANLARPGDLVFTQRGNAVLNGGQVAIVPDGPFNRYVVSQSQMKLTPDQSKVDARFLYFVFTSSDYRHYLRSNAIVTGVPHINLGLLRNYELSLPLLAEQKRIAYILGTLDDKIELNRRMNATLDAMARALFQSWFVNFDPVRKNAEGGNKRPDDSLFPNSFEDSESGEMPNGWKVLRLDKIATYLNGLALQKFPPGDGETLPVIKIAQLRKGDSSGADRCNIDVPNDYVVQDGDVLFSWSGSLEVELWCGGRGALNQHLFKVTSSDFPKWFYYLWTLHHLDEFRLIAASKATTMGHIQRKHLTEAKVLVPSRPLLGHMTEILSPIVDRIIANRIESRTLATLRDTLLPKLLSGELVSDKNFQRSERITTCP
jgi:type I restriction enzyme S subunit